MPEVPILSGFLALRVQSRWITFSVMSRRLGPTMVRTKTPPLLGIYLARQL